MDRVLIIAEAGVNHNGSMDMAKQLVDLAYDCGVDIVKFQTTKLEALVTKAAPMAEYQVNNTKQKTNQQEALKNVILSYDEHRELYQYCKEKGIEYLSTPFDIGSIHFLNDMVSFWKVPSGEITNYPYLREIGKTKKDVIMSTGMSTLEEIREAIGVLKKFGTPKITLLQCTTEYPAPIEEINLRAMKRMKEEFACEVGFSDHTEGIEVPLAAVAMGASVIEKHFTLDKTLPGLDHKASASPEELRQLVNGIRKVECALGSADKIVGFKEAKNKDVARKSIVAARDIKAGENFSEENLTTKRPGNGVSPMRWEEIIGTVANRNYKADEIIEL